MAKTIGDLLNSDKYSGGPFEPTKDGFEFWDQSEPSSDRSKGLTVDQLFRNYENVELKDEQVINAGKYTSSTADGGKAIQAAIDDLPSRGGRVFIPQEGPDDGVSSAFYNNNENGVWEVNQPIDTGKKSNIWIQGASTGWSLRETGTTLIAGSNISDIFILRKGFLSGISDLRLDGGENFKATTCLTLGDAGSENDFVCERLAISGAAGQGIKVDVAQNIWTRNLWVELNNGPGINISSLESYFWSLNNLFYLNDPPLEINDSCNRLWILNNKIDGDPGITGVNDPSNGIVFNNDVDFAVIRGSFFEGFDNSSIKITSTNTLKNSSLKNINVNGLSTTSHVIDNQGTLQDCTIKNVKATNITGSKYVNVVHDLTNTTRVVVDGLGYNQDQTPPTAGGDWNGHGREGIQVFWIAAGPSPAVSEYMNGTWYGRRL